MAHPRKKSRLSLWAPRPADGVVAVNHDDSWLRVAVYGEDTVNGAEIRFETGARSTTAGVVSRVIGLGRCRGFDPADRSNSLHLSAQEVLEAVHGYDHPLVFGAERYLWTPVFQGGAYLRIRGAAAPEGQLLATMTELKPDHLGDRLAAAFISLGLRSGWQPLRRGLDCHWLDRGSCLRVVEELFPDARSC